MNKQQWVAHPQDSQLLTECCSILEARLEYSCTKQKKLLPLLSHMVKWSLHENRTEPCISQRSELMITWKCFNFWTSSSSVCRRYASSKSRCNFFFSDSNCSIWWGNNGNTKQKEQATAVMSTEMHQRTQECTFCTSHSNFQQSPWAKNSTITCLTGRQCRQHYGKMNCVHVFLISQARSSPHTAVGAAHCLTCIPSTSCWAFISTSSSSSFIILSVLTSTPSAKRTCHRNHHTNLRRQHTHSHNPAMKNSLHTQARMKHSRQTPTWHKSCQTEDD